MRAVRVEQEVDLGGRAACRIARVKMDQIFDEGSGVRYEIKEAMETREPEM
jgi:hypothetical protein